MVSADLAPGQPSERRHPRALAAYVWGVCALGALAVLLVVPGGGLSSLSALEPGPRLALGTVVVLVLAVQMRTAQMHPVRLLPGASDDPRRGMPATSLLGGPAAALLLAVVLHVGPAAALALHVVVATLCAVVRRRYLLGAAFDAARRVLALLAAWVVVRALDVAPSPPTPWAPQDLADLAVVALAAVAALTTAVALTASAQALGHGVPWRAAVAGEPRRWLLVDLAYCALTPVVLALMAGTPALAWLALVPVLAVHQAAEASLRSDHASRDHLTGLGSRTFLVTAATLLLADAVRTRGRAALLVLGLDRFREVNALLGHGAGDAVLQQVAGRLLAAVRPSDVVVRLGGDEFAVVLPDVAHPQEAEAVARRLRSALQTPLDLDGRPVELDVSIGVALVPDHAVEYDALLGRADAAMYRAKAARTGVVVYDASWDERSAPRLGLAAALRAALESGGVELHFQPLAALRDGGVVGVAAQARWRDPAHGLLQAQELQELAERSRVTARLTEAVLDGALAQVASWVDLGVGVPVAVAVTLRDLEDPGFGDRVEDLLRRHGVPPSLLVLEVAGRGLAAEAGPAVVVLRELATAGVRLCLDDFGADGSSVRLLRGLPLTQVKLDRALVTGASVAADDAVVVRGVAALAHDLGLTVAAEGVETAVGWETLRGLGVDVAQGWYVSRPLPAAEVGRWLLAREEAREATRARAVKPRMLPPRPRPPGGGEQAATSP